MTRVKDRQTIPEIPQQILQQRAELQEANRIAGYDLSKIGISNEQSKRFPPQLILNSPSNQAQVTQQSLTASSALSETIQTSEETGYQQSQANGDIIRLSPPSSETFLTPETRKEDHAVQPLSDPNGETSKLPYNTFISSLRPDTFLNPSHALPFPQDFAQSSLYNEGVPSNQVEHPHQLLTGQISNGEASHSRLEESEKSTRSPFGINKNVQTFQNQSLQQPFTQPFIPDAYTQPPAMLSQASTLELNQNGSSSGGSCCGGSNGADLEPENGENKGVYFMSQNAATLDNPMTEQRYLQLQSENPWWQQERTDRKQVVHECRCKNCMCTACPVHPFNPVMNQQMQHIARSHPQEMLQLAYNSKPLTSSTTTSDVVYSGFNDLNDQTIPYSNTSTAAFDLSNSRLKSDPFIPDAQPNYNNNSSIYRSGPVFDTSSHSVFQYDNAFPINDPDNLPSGSSQWNILP